MNKETKNSNTMRENESKNEGGREFGRVHEPSQTQEASSRRGLADDSMPDSRLRQQTPSQRQEGSRRGSGTQQSRPPGNTAQGRKKTHQSARKAA
jgi:hypothetical protein